MVHKPFITICNNHINKSDRNFITLDTTFKKCTFYSKYGLNMSVNHDNVFTHIWALKCLLIIYWAWYFNRIVVHYDSYPIDKNESFGSCIMIFFSPMSAMKGCHTSGQVYRKSHTFKSISNVFSFLIVCF